MAAVYKRNKLHMEDVALERVAEKYGTPIYCYSQTQLENNFNAYNAAMCGVTDKKNFTICYAVKANSNQAVLKTLALQGAGADVVSGGELYRATRVGIPAGKIVYSGVGKSVQELTAAIKKGILQINVESETELLLISKIAKSLKKMVRIGLRVNPDVDAKTHHKITTGRKENKFGIDIDCAPALYDKAKKLPYIQACGVAVHIGSQLVSLAPYKKAYKRVAGLVENLRARGHNITTVDLGGGIGVQYDDETPPDLNLYAAIINDIILPLNVHVVIEPGRSIAGNAGVLLSRVINVKKGADKIFVILDAAMNDLLRPSLYEAYHEIQPCQKSGVGKVVCDIVGPICETGDTFHLAKKMQPLKTGDLVAIKTSGAYGAVMASTYNTRPLVGEVMVQGSRFTIVRKPPSIKEMVDADIIPRWVA